MAFADEWLHVDHFTVDQAAALWADIDPSTFNVVQNVDKNPRTAAIKQMIVGAIMSGKMPHDASANIMASIGTHGTTLVSRDALKALAVSKGTRPKFLFDTILPGVSPDRATDTDRDSPTRKVGGRPAEYDWDAMYLEIVRYADVEALPSVQAELIGHLQQWFEDTYGKQPSETQVKAKVSAIYKALAAKGWKPKDG